MHESMSPDTPPSLRALGAAALALVLALQVLAGCSRCATPRCREVAPLRVGAATDWTAIVADFEYSCGLRGAGALYCWGSNGSGKVGDGTTTDRSAPVRIGIAEGWHDLALADFVTCGLRGEDGVYCWGAQQDGRMVSQELGNAAPEEVTLRSTADDAGAPLAITQIVVADAHSCVRTHEGRVYCLGGVAERLGAPGDPVGRDRASKDMGVAVPIDLSAFDPAPVFRRLEAGSKHTCGLTTDGQVVCWGVNEWGQVGSGSTAPLVERPTLVDLGALGEDVRVARLEMGTFHTCALTEDDRAVCWGANFCGCLGVGDSRPRLAPVAVDASRVGGSGRFRALSAGYNATCGVSLEGLLYCWGQCSHESRTDLTDPEALPCLLPRAVRGPGGERAWPVREVSVGTGHACAVATDGSLWCWGQNGQGQCGIGQTSDGTHTGASPEQAGGGR